MHDTYLREHLEDNNKLQNARQYNEFQLWLANQYFKLTEYIS